MTTASAPRTIQDHTPQTQNRYSITGSFRGLMAAVINRTLADLEKDSSAIKTNLQVKDEAMALINSPDCKAFCHALDMDYAAIREKAAALYRRFLEREEGREKARGRLRRSEAEASLFEDTELRIGEHGREEA